MTSLINQTAHHPSLHLVPRMFLKPQKLIKYKFYTTVNPSGWIFTQLIAFFDGRAGGNQRQFIAIKQTARIQLSVLIVKHHVSFPAIHKSSHGDVATKKVGLLRQNGSHCKT